MPIYNFNEIIKANDFRFLVKDFDEYEQEEFKLGVNEVVEARSIFKELLYEYSAITANRHIMLKYNAEIKIEEESFRYLIIEKVLNNYVEHSDKDVLQLLNKVDVAFDINGNIEAQVVKVISLAKRLKTKIAIMKIKYDERFNKNIKARLKEEVIDNLEEEAIELGVAIKAQYQIDTRKTSVKRWVSMWKVAGKMNKPVKTN